MPFPLLALAPALVSWGTRSLAVYGLAGLFTSNPLQELERMLKAWVVEEAARRAGLDLDPDNPWTDASISNAVGQRVGIPIRSLRDPVMVREDLDNFAADLISAKSGYTVRSVVDVGMLKEDLLQIGTAEFSARLGIPAGVMPGAGVAFDPVAVREQVLTWAKAELMTRVNDDVMLKLGEIIAAGDLEAVAIEMNGTLQAMSSDETVTARQLAVQIASRMATAAVTDYNKLALSGSKKQRRRELLRWYQKKFRARHGNRQKYIPLGWGVTYIPPP